MKEELTDKEKRIIYGILNRYFEDMKMPTRELLAGDLGISPQLLQYRLRKMQVKGYIEIRPRKREGLVLL